MSEHLPKYSLSHHLSSAQTDSLCQHYIHTGIVRGIVEGIRAELPIKKDLYAGPFTVMQNHNPERDFYNSETDPLVRAISAFGVRIDYWLTVEEAVREGYVSPRNIPSAQVLPLYMSVGRGGATESMLVLEPNRSTDPTLYGQKVHLITLQDFQVSSKIKRSEYGITQGLDEDLRTRKQQLLEGRELCLATESPDKIQDPEALELLLESIQNYRKQLELMYGVAIDSQLKKN